MIICLEQLNHWCTESMFNGSAWGMFFPKFRLGILLSVKKKYFSDFLIMNPELSYVNSAITSYF